MITLKSENQRKPNERQVLGPHQKTKKAEEHEGDRDTYGIWHTWNSAQRLGKEAERVRHQTTNQNDSNYSIVEIEQNAEKIPGDLKRLVVTQTPVKDHPLAVVGKTLKK